jgi:hypothetical protein
MFHTSPKLTSPASRRFNGSRVYQDLMGIGPSLREFCQQEDGNIPNEDRDHTTSRR